MAVDSVRAPEIVGNDAVWIWRGVLSSLISMESSSMPEASWRINWIGIFCWVRISSWLGVRAISRGDEVSMVKNLGIDGRDSGFWRVSTTFAKKV